MHLTFEQKKDHQLSFVFCYMLFGIFLTNASSVLFQMFGISPSFVSTLNKAIILVLLLSCALIILKRMHVEAFLFCGSLLLLFAINYMLNDPRSGFLSLLPEFMTTVLPVIIITFCINDYDVFLESLVKVSPFILSLSLLAFFIKGEAKNEYYMGFANSLLIPVVSALHAFFYQGKKTMVIFAALGILVIVALGSRGALLSIAMFFLVVLFKNVLSMRRSLVSVVIILIILVSIVFFQEIIQALNNFLLANGFSSRTLRSLLSDEIQIGGRNDIYSAMLEGIRSHPLKIRGIGTENIVAGTYAHNFILEILYQFGIILGGSAVLLLVFYMFKTIFIMHKTSFDYVLLIIFCVAIPIGLVSNTIWRAPYFWMWIVLCIKKSMARYYNNYGGSK